MKILQIQHRALKKLLPAPAPKPGQAMRPFDYLITKQVPEGLLAYQAALCSLVLLEGDEQALLQGGVCPEEPSDTLRFLAEHRFLVAAEHDDHAFCQTVREAARLIRRLTEEEGCGSFTVLPTTACNARCFYCFEKDCEAQTMTAETADAVVDYILKYGKKKIHLGWFGGEPTVNARIIDRICEALAAAGREFTSSMISNGYLMDETLVGKAAARWKLNSIQITLDGTEEIYNERKNYAGIQGSAFRKVLGNIGLLLDAGIAVHIRLNADTENAGDLCALADQLKARFGVRKNLRVYSSALFEDECLPSSYGERLDANHAVNLHLRALGYERGGMLDSFPRTNCCMADSGSSPVIMPDGGIRSCEHINAAQDWGSVFRPEKRPDAESAYWGETLPEQPECRGCIAYPSCIRLRHCEPGAKICTDEMRARSCEELVQRLGATWNEIKAHQANIQSNG